MSPEPVPLVGWISPDIARKPRVVIPLLWLRHEREKTWLEPTLNIAAAAAVPNCLFGVVPTTDALSLPGEFKDEQWPTLIGSYTLKRAAFNPLKKLP